MRSGTTYSPTGARGMSHSVDLVAAARGPREPHWKADSLEDPSCGGRVSTAERTMGPAQVPSKRERTVRVPTPDRSDGAERGTDEARSENGGQWGAAVFRAD